MGSGPSWGRRWAVQQISLEHLRAAERRAHLAACWEWNTRMAEGGPAQPSPTIRAALNASYACLRVRCSRCRKVAFVALATVRRPADTPIWKFEDALACQSCWQQCSLPPRGRIERLTRDARDFGWVET